MINSVGASAPSQNAPVTAPAEQTSNVSTDTFLQLLVAQIKNQNPLSPADGVQFLTQLAQFTELEQMAGIKSEVTALREAMTQPSATAEGKTELSGASNV